MVVQTLTQIKKPVQRHFKKYPKASIYSSFRKYRKQEQYSVIADSPLLSAIVYAVAELGIKPNETSIKRVFRNSSELRGQVRVCATLIDDAMRAFYEAKSISKEVTN